jgi:hypothetical protein
VNTIYPVPTPLLAIRPGGGSPLPGNGVITETGSYILTETGAYVILE